MDVIDGFRTRGMILTTFAMGGGNLLMICYPFLVVFVVVGAVAGSNLLHPAAAVAAGGVDLSGVPCYNHVGVSL
jgi:hypothetical protein